MLSIGLSLISVGINSFGGGNSAKDFGSMENLLLALFVLVVILVVKHGCKGFLGLGPRSLSALLQATLRQSSWVLFCRPPQLTRTV